MDQYFNEFLNYGGFTPIAESTSVEKETYEGFQNKLPSRLLKYWKEYGFTGFSDGLFWIVNPNDYQDILNKWLQKTPMAERDSYYVIARSAFGELYIWGSKSRSVTILNPHLNNILPGDFSHTPLEAETIDKAIGVFFMAKSKKATDYRDKNDKLLFDRCLKKYGPLAHDEMYTFSPALALGGSADIKNIKKEKIHEQLSMLCDLDTPIVLPSTNELFGSV